MSYNIYAMTSIYLKKPIWIILAVKKIFHIILPRTTSAWLDELSCSMLEFFRFTATSNRLAEPKHQVEMNCYWFSILEVYIQTQVQVLDLFFLRMNVDTHSQ